MPDGSSHATAEIVPINAENPAPKQRGRPFPAGVSGNPRGKLPGTRNRITRLAEALMDDSAEEIVQMAIKKALKGSDANIELIVDRLVAPRRSRPITVKLPEIKSSADVVYALAAINEALYRGEIDGEQLDSLTRYLSAAGEAIDSKS